MKKLFFGFIFFLIIILTSCEESEPVVGSNESSTIQNLSIVVDTTYLDASNSRLIAKGSVKNNGNSEVTSPWHVECQFYTNSTRTIKLGGNYTQIGVPLSKNQSTFWTISYTSTNVNVNDYPDFAVGDLRGIYK